MAIHGDSNPASSAWGGMQKPLKQKMSVRFKSLLDSAKKLTIGGDLPGANDPAPAHAKSATELFPKVKPDVDGDDCNRDCDNCVVRYPKNFKVEEDDILYGFVKGWSTHVLVATGKTDWVRDVQDEKGSVMQAIGNTKGPSNGVCSLEKHDSI